jgi:threonylcarbamoyladenosine tRNA methylthiotransferase MtaB
MRVCLTHLGCKLNQAELEGLARRLRAAGHEVVSTLEGADLQVVNTCTVTQTAARRSRQAVRRGGGSPPVVVTGCWATERPHEATALPGVALVVPNPQKDRLPELLAERFPALAAAVDDLGSTPRWRSPGEAFGKTRALVKIEDGCNLSCAFCIIPRTRGRQRSRPPAEVVAEVAALTRAGAQEVILEGVQISHYRSGGRGLRQLVEVVLEETPVSRLRLTSLAPWRFDPGLLPLLAGDRVCRHVHLALQSGCTATLERMGRPYTAERFRRLVEDLQRAVPGIAITTDVIAGFPGETAAEFEESLAFVREMGFARVHAFPFSPRPGTVAAAMPDPVAPVVRQERMTRLLDAAAELETAFHRCQVGKRLDVVWLGRRPDGLYRGISDNYVPVVAPSSAELAGRLTPVEIRGLADGAVWGRIEEDGGALTAGPRPPGLPGA